MNSSASKTLIQHTHSETGSFKWGSYLPCTVHIHLLEAQNLYASDSTKLSSPYFIFAVKSSEDKQQKSPIYPRTIEPVANFQTSLSFKETKLLGMSVLKVKIFDQAKGILKDTLLGKVLIPLADLVHNGIISGWFSVMKKDKKSKEYLRAQGRIYIRIIGDKYCKPLEKQSSQDFILRRSQLLDLVRLIEVDYVQMLRFEVIKYLEDLDEVEKKKIRERRRQERLAASSHQASPNPIDRPTSLNSPVSHTNNTNQTSPEVERMTLSDKNILRAEEEEEEALLTPNRDVSAKFSLSTVLRKPATKGAYSTNGSSMDGNIATRGGGFEGLFVSSSNTNNNTNMMTPQQRQEFLNSANYLPSFNSIPNSTSNPNPDLISSNINGEQEDDPHRITALVDNTVSPVSFFYNPVAIAEARDIQNNTINHHTNNNTTLSKLQLNTSSRGDSTPATPTNNNPRTRSPSPSTERLSSSPLARSSLAVALCDTPRMSPQASTKTLNITPTISPLSQQQHHHHHQQQQQPSSLSSSSPSPPSSQSQLSFNRRTSNSGLPTPSISLGQVRNKTLFSMPEGREDSSDCDEGMHTINPPHVILENCEGRRNIIYAPESLPIISSLPPVPYQSTSPCFICSPFQHPPFKMVPIDYVSSQPLGDLPKRHEAIFDAHCITQDDTTLPVAAYKLSLCCCTWNVGNAPPSEPKLLKAWLREECDIYVIGTQENEYTPRKGYKTHSEDFTTAILTTLGPEYELLKSEDLGQIHIHLIVKKMIKPYIDLFQPQHATCATGFLGTLPNKGGACIAMSVFGTSFAFLSSHLAAHTHMKEKRDQDMRSIVRGVNFHGAYAQTSIMNAFNHVFWLGDLNYRLTFAGDGQKPDPVKFELMLDKIKDESYDELLLTDQLLFNTLENRTAFVGFNDSPINFAPSFKVKKGQLLEYDRMRSPSYTDRILWKSQHGYEKQIHFSSFDSAKDVISSDHKPVSSVFHIYPSIPVPGVSNRLSNVTFTLTSLSLYHITNANGIDPDPTSVLSPYVRISSTLLGSAVQTSSKRGNPNANNNINYHTELLQQQQPPSQLPYATWSPQELPPLVFTASSEGRLWESSIIFGVFELGGTLKATTLLSSATLSLKSEDIVSFLHDNAYTHQLHKALELGPKIPSQLQLLPNECNNDWDRDGGICGGLDHSGFSGNLYSLTSASSSLLSPLINNNNPSSLQHYLNNSSSIIGNGSNNSLGSHASVSLLKPNNKSLLSMMPDTPSLRIAEGGSGLELELDRSLQLYTPNGKEGGVLKITGVISFQKIPRVTEYQHVNE